MSEELLQLLFFAFIFIALPTLDGILRGKKKKQKQRGPAGRGPVAEAEVEWDPAGERGGHFDPATEPGQAGGARASAEAADGTARRSSEGLLPADLWEELAALARGDARPGLEPQRTADTAQEPATPERIEPWTGPPATVDTEETTDRPSQVADGRSRAPRPYPPRPTPRAPGTSWREVESHTQPPPTPGAARQGTPIGRAAFPEAARSPIETGAIGASAEQGAHLGAAGEVLGALRRMSKDDLKRAVIFREVLGPPIAERGKAIGGLRGAVGT